MIQESPCALRLPTRTLLLADGQALVRDGLRALLRDVAGFAVVGETGDGIDALERVRRLQPDALLLDAGLPGLNGLDITAQVARSHPDVRVLMLTDRASPEFVARSLASGVRPAVWCRG